MSPSPARARAGRPLAALLVAVLALLALAAAGCGDDAGPSASAPATTGGAGPFPLTIEHRFGETVIPAEPRRVIAFGRDDEAIAALDGPLIGIMRDTEYPDGMSPWLAEALGAAKPVLLPFGDLPPFERIADLRPDLIVADFIDRETYDRLAQIAPTVAPITGEGIYGQDTWQEKTIHDGTALGREARARRLVAETEALAAKVPEDHPAMRGAAFTWAWYGGEGVLYAFVDDTSTSLLKSMGMVPSPLLPLPKGGVSAEVSLERLDLLEADLLVVAYGTEAARRSLEGNALFQRLDVVRRGGYVGMDGTEASPLVHPSVLSVPHTIENLIPRLARAVEAGG